MQTAVRWHGSSAAAVLRLHVRLRSPLLPQGRRHAARRMHTGRGVYGAGAARSRRAETSAHAAHAGAHATRCAHADTGAHAAHAGAHAARCVHADAGANEAHAARGLNVAVGARAARDPCCWPGGSRAAKAPPHAAAVRATSTTSKAVAAAAAAAAGDAGAVLTLRTKAGEAAAAVAGVGTAAAVGLVEAGAGTAAAARPATADQLPHASRPLSRRALLLNGGAFTAAAAAAAATAAAGPAPAAAAPAAAAAAVPVRDEEPAPECTPVLYVRGAGSAAPPEGVVSVHESVSDAVRSAPAGAVVLVGAGR
eukprot:352195-Chlamydomonas_euryale.AAC.2